MGSSSDCSSVRNEAKHGATGFGRIDLFKEALPPGVGPVRVVRQLAAVSGLGRDAVETRDVLGIGTVEALVLTRFCELGPKRFFVAGRAKDAGDDFEPVRRRLTHTSDLQFFRLHVQR